MNKIEEVSAVIELKKYIEEYRDVEKFLGFCHECNGFGKTWACPPYEKPIGFDGLNYAHIVGTKIYVSEEMRKIEMTKEKLTAAVEEILLPVRLQLDQRLLELEKLNEGSRAHFAGSCRRCATGTCTRPSGKPCAKPNEMRQSLEAIGFDIAKTGSELLGIELKWSEKYLPEYFTLVYGLFTKDKTLKQ